MNTLTASDDRTHHANELRAELRYEMQALFDPCPAPAPAASLALHIGRLRPVPVASAEQASRIWQLYRDGLGLSGSDSPTVLLKHGGQTVGYVSYNGRVWKGKPTSKAQQNPLVADAAKVSGVQVGDWLFVEDMMNGRGAMMEVKAVYSPARAITLEAINGQRIYMREQGGHDRFFAIFTLA